MYAMTFGLKYHKYANSVSVPLPIKANGTVDISHIPKAENARYNVVKKVGFEFYWISVSPKDISNIRYQKYNGFGREIDIEGVIKNFSLVFSCTVNYFIYMYSFRRNC